MSVYVVCIDGTWNNPGQKDKDPVLNEEVCTETNVLLIYRYLTGDYRKGIPNGSVEDLRADNGGGSPGEAMYLYGVGTTGTFIDLYEGATGTGTSERICDGYRFLAARHQPGDRIFIFGFSRGAFAARSLAGFIQYVGLPKTPANLSEDQVKDAYSRYRFRGKKTVGPTSMGREAAVDFLGVWDTVGALAFGRINDFHLLSPESVKRVAHALALDEQREAFMPTFWEKNKARKAKEETHVEETWFAGVHTNIGGGYLDQGLSNIALAWVASRAIEAGLPLSMHFVQGWPADALGPMRDSYEEFVRQIKIIGGLVCSKIQRTVQPGQNIHAYVFKRLTGIKPPQPPYVPHAIVAPEEKPFPTAIAAWAPSRVVDTPDYERPKI